MIEKPSEDDEVVAPTTVTNTTTNGKGSNNTNKTNKFEGKGNNKRPTDRADRQSAGAGVDATGAPHKTSSSSSSGARAPKEKGGDNTNNNNNNNNKERGESRNNTSNPKDKNTRSLFGVVAKQSNLLQDHSKVSKVRK